MPMGARCPDCVMPQPTLPAKIAAALDRFPPVHSLGVAISGGPDSVALLGALVALAPHYDCRLTALHVNHRLRPEADQEQRLVETLCRQWQVPCVVESLDPPPNMRSGIEAWARDERYRVFRDACQRYNLDAVALAHTLDDQAETVLFRLLRGSARRGLAGIPPLREGWVIRPLLDCTRAEVLAYLEARRLPYATDASNAELRFSRNKIRQVLLPFLEREFSPQVRRHLAAVAATTRTEEDWLEELATEARRRVEDAFGSFDRDVAPGPVGGPCPVARLSLSRLAAEPPALRIRILRQWLEQSGHTHDLRFVHLERVYALSVGAIHGRVELPGDLCVRREGEGLLYEHKRQQPIARCAYNYPLAPGGEIVVPHTGWQVVMTPPLHWDRPLQQARCADRWQALFDADALSETLWVRSVRPGDRICPLGMQGHKKVHDIFIDAKIAPQVRAGFPLITLGSLVAWVPGCVRGEVAKVTASTRQVCWLTVHPLPGKGKLC
jgi:tRNA(Ile)-lysidine synthase